MNVAAMDTFYLCIGAGPQQKFSCKMPISQIAAAVASLNESGDSFQDSPAMLHSAMDPVAAMRKTPS